MNRLTRYALGLLVEEMGEALCAIGRALRFGIDTPEGSGQAAREKIAFELGDVKAAIRYADDARVVDGLVVEDREDSKTRKLRSPDSLDNLGRRLAPDPGAPDEQPTASLAAQLEMANTDLCIAILSGSDIDEIKGHTQLIGSIAKELAAL